MRGTRTGWQGLLLAAVGLALGCATAPPRPVEVEVPADARLVEDHILYAPTTWSGDLVLVRPLIVTRSASLTLQPGTRLFFRLPEAAPGQQPDPWILVMGTMVALGSEARPIVFQSVTPRQNELEDMVKVDQAKEAHFRHCLFQGGPWGLHIHQTRVDIDSCRFVDNFGGVRFQGGPVLVERSHFVANQIGMRCLRGSPRIVENVFDQNRTAIFFREGIEQAVVARNNFASREYHIKLGEGQPADVVATGNWWATEEGASVGDKIYDAADSEGLGRVVTGEPLPHPWGTPAPEQ